LKHKQLILGGKQTMQMLLNLFANSTNNLEETVNALSINTIGVAAILLIVLLVIASQVVNNKKLHSLKTPLFALIAATIVLPTLLLAVSTVYVNVVSESGGPVHWHTDIEFWACGTELEFRDPTGFLSNKIGTATYHEHDDKRIHLEGVVIEKSYDASLEKFMDVTGGSIDQDRITIPVNVDYIENDVDGDVAVLDQGFLNQYVTVEDGLATMELVNGNTCTNGEPGVVQAFLMRYQDGENSYTQTKLTDPASYLMRDESIVPPGDCVIVEFDTPKSATDKLCQQYGVRDIERCTEFGLSEFNAELCNLRQIVTQGGSQ
jgi:hypothetical protein